MLYGHADIITVLRRNKSPLFQEIDQGLELYYDFRVGGYDLTGRGRHAIFNDRITFNLNGALTTGVSGNYISSPIFTTTGTDKYSVELSFILLDSQLKGIFNWGNTPTDNTPWLYLQRNGINPSTCRWYWGLAYQTAFSVEDKVNLRLPIHLVFTSTGAGDARMFYNGKLVATSSFVPSGVDNLYIYAGVGYAGYQMANFLFLKLYKRVLSPEEVFIKSINAGRNYGRYY